MILHLIQTLDLSPVLTVILTGIAMAALLTLLIAVTSQPSQGE